MAIYISKKNRYRPLLDDTSKLDARLRKRILREQAAANLTSGEKLSDLPLPRTLTMESSDLPGSISGMKRLDGELLEIKEKESTLASILHTPSRRQSGARNKRNQLKNPFAR